jgi:trehalose 6-phosphate phosphatase
VLEIKPRGASKARAIGEFMREPPFAGRRPVFVGDDVTDEDGFCEVRRHGGVAVVVDGREGTQAQYRLADVAAVGDWLSGWLAGREGGSA